MYSDVKMNLFFSNNHFFMNSHLSLVSIDLISSENNEWDAWGTYLVTGLRGQDIQLNVGIPLHFLQELSILVLYGQAADLQKCWGHTQSVL